MPVPEEFMGSGLPMIHQTIENFFYLLSLGELKELGSPRLEICQNSGHGVADN